MAEPAITALPTTAMITTNSGGRGEGGTGAGEGVTAGAEGGTGAGGGVGAGGMTISGGGGAGSTMSGG